MLQAAFGGYYLIEDGRFEYVDNLVYYEPGFNIMFPLEIQGPVSDEFYILLRKRSNNTGIVFDNISYGDFEETISDATTGESVPYTLSDNTLNLSWNNLPSSNPSSFASPFVLKITNVESLTNPVNRIRAIDCSIKYITYNNFINFRVLIDDDSQSFHYIPIETNNLANRNTFTANGRDIYVSLNETTDHYILFSPYAYLKEVDEDESDFSYPIGSIFYRRQNTSNKENYLFSINAYSHSYIPDVISLLNVPGYHKAAVVLVDRMAYTHLALQGENAYLDISVIGELSGISDTFRINLKI